MLDRFVLSIALTIAAPAAYAQEADATADECAESSTTVEMRVCSDQLNQQAESQLAEALRRARERAGVRSQAALIEAQARWEQYRDAQCEAEGAQYEGGSIQPVVILGCRLVLTEQRAEYLDGLFHLPQPGAGPESPLRA
ncbi:lysozyme inhibitor LprI family protein [Gemmatimonadota bacterium]